MELKKILKLLADAKNKKLSELNACVLKDQDMKKLLKN